MFSLAVALMSLGFFFNGSETYAQSYGPKIDWRGNLLDWDIDWTGYPYNLYVPNWSTATQIVWKCSESGFSNGLPTIGTNVNGTACISIWSPSTSPQEVYIPHPQSGIWYRVNLDISGIIQSTEPVYITYNRKEQTPTITNTTSTTVTAPLYQTGKPYHLVCDMNEDGSYNDINSGYCPTNQGIWSAHSTPERCSPYVATTQNFHEIIENTGLWINDRWPYSILNENHACVVPWTVQLPVDPIDPGFIPRPGLCGTAHNSSFATAPTTNLCQRGTPSPVNGTGPWDWQCSGINGGAAVSCTAQTSNSVAQTDCPSCRDVWCQDQFGTIVDDSLCDANMMPVLTGTVPAGSVSWCPLNSINGACGPLHGQTVLVSGLEILNPLNLCSAGTVSWYLAHHGIASWQCLGANGGSTVSCNTEPLITVVTQCSDVAGNACTDDTQCGTWGTCSDSTTQIVWMPQSVNPTDRSPTHPQYNNVCRIPRSDGSLPTYNWAATACLVPSQDYMDTHFPDGYVGSCTALHEQHGLAWLNCGWKAESVSYSTCECAWWSCAEVTGNSCTNDSQCGEWGACLSAWISVWLPDFKAGAEFVGLTVDNRNSTHPWWNTLCEVWNQALGTAPWSMVGSTGPVNTCLEEVSNRPYYKNYCRNMNLNTHGALRCGTTVTTTTNTCGCTENYAWDIGEWWMCWSGTTTSGESCQIARYPDLDNATAEYYGASRCDKSTQEQCNTEDAWIQTALNEYFEPSGSQWQNPVIGAQSPEFALVGDPNGFDANNYAVHSYVDLNAMGYNTMLIDYNVGWPENYLDLTYPFNNPTGNFPLVENTDSANGVWNRTLWPVCVWLPTITVSDNMQNRTVVCRNSSGAIVADSFCPQPKPDTTQTCGGSWGGSTAYVCTQQWSQGNFVESTLPWNQQACDTDAWSYGLDINGHWAWSLVCATSAPANCLCTVGSLEPDCSASQLEITP